MNKIRFDGKTYSVTEDKDRLTSQLEKVRGLMLTGRIFTLRQLAKLVKGSEAGVSARIRDLRKTRFGGYRIDRTRGNNGLHFYQYLNEDTNK